MRGESCSWPSVKFPRSESSPYYVRYILRPLVIRKLTQIVIDDVDFSIAGQFLYFLYTGEPRKSFANEQLLKLAKRYQLATLISLCLCDDALRNIVTKEMAHTLISLTPEKNPMLAFEIWYVLSNLIS